MLTQSVTDFAGLCAQAFLQIVDEHETSSEQQAALLLVYTDPGSTSEPVTAQAWVVLETERNSMLERLRHASASEHRSWPDLWNRLEEYSNALDDRYLLAEFLAERQAVTIELQQADVSAPDNVFWPEVARQLNAGPHPKHAGADWCAAAIDYAGGDVRGQLEACVPADTFARLEAAGYIGPRIT